MLCMPMSGHVDASADPDAIVFQNMIEKSGKSSRARRAAGDARVESDGHQDRRSRAFLVKLVERRLEIDLEIRRCPETGGLRELSVICVHSVGHDEVILACDIDPVGKLVVVGVEVVEESPLFDEQATGSLAGAVTAIPA